jgi:hypothetical protein
MSCAYSPQSAQESRRQRYTAFLHFGRAASEISTNESRERHSPLGELIQDVEAREALLEGFVRP